MQLPRLGRRARFQCEKSPPAWEHRARIGRALVFSVLNRCNHRRRRLKFKSGTLCSAAQRRLRDAGSLGVDISVLAIAVFGSKNTVDTGTLKTPGGKTGCVSRDILLSFLRWWRAEPEADVPLGCGPRATVAAAGSCVAAPRCAVRTDVH